MRGAVERYLAELQRTRATGAAADEVSYYGALRVLLNEVGDRLRPRVHCVMQPRDQGAGLPDGGRFTEDQLRGEASPALDHGAIPARGVVEVKPTSHDVDIVARGEQVGRYLGRYGQVLVTNYRDFLLVEERGGACRVLDRLELAPSESDFWAAAPRALAAAEGDRLVDFLERVLRHGAPLAEPRDVAWYLASYAREALHRIRDADLETLETFRKAMEEALDVKFEGEDGDAFFRSTLVQTLFYGVFSAWVHWARDASGPAATFDWRIAAFHEHVPVLRQLFHVVADPGQLRRLRLDEVLDWTGDALNRVVRDDFFRSFDQNLAVQYFYEPFLEAFDPELRKRLGVWYTPPEIVEYMVERVDTVLRTELGLTDGLADRRVRILDPACGTGAYLVGVLERIARTLREKGDDALLAADLKRAATERVFGFEILPASFVVAHLQLGLILRNHDAPLDAETHERAAVYLTNALTDWDEDDEASPLPFPELQREREAAERVKREEEILVVIGNPPYDGYAGMAIGEEGKLVDEYRKTRRAPKPQGQGLNDLYVRFFRVAERRIVEMSGRGIVCYITNYSWLDGLSHTGMRERFLDVFDQIWIDNLNGDKYRTGKLTPEGLPDPSVFSTEFNREGIQVGTAVALLLRKDEHEPADSVLYRELWGRDKRRELLETVEQTDDEPYRAVEPPVELGVPFMPTTVGEEYFAWPTIPALFEAYFPGVQTKRDELVIDIDRERLIDRMRQYFDPGVDDNQMATICARALQKTAAFDPKSTRQYLQTRGFREEYVVPHAYRPLDIRWLYWEPETNLLERKVPQYLPHALSGSPSIVTQRKPRRAWSVPQVISMPGCLDLMDRSASIFPLYLRPDAPADESGNGDLFAQPLDDDPLLAPNGLRYNLTDRAVAYLETVGDVHDAPALFHHVIAVLHAPAYRHENAGALRQDWPRVPLPSTREALLASAELGLELAALLDPEREVPGVTAGTIRLEHRGIGVIRRRDGGQVRPDLGELEVEARWGYAGQGGVVMPGPGRAVERAYTEEEAAALDAAGTDLGLSWMEIVDRLGETTYDIWLNDVVYWKNVPARVWEYTLGGYPVIKKWLSYRERAVLGRGLEVDEARYVTEMARRIAAILLLESRLNANYRAVGEG